MGSEVRIKYVHLSNSFIWLGTLLIMLICIFFTLFLKIFVTEQNIELNFFVYHI